MEIFEFVRAVLGFVLVLFVPGYAASWALFPSDDDVDLIERVALSIGLSIALVVLSVYVLNVAVGVKINAVNSLAVIAGVTLFCSGVYFMRVGGGGSGGEGERRKTTLKAGKSTLKRSGTRKTASKRKT